MAHQQIVALIVIIVGIVFVGTNAYFTGRRDGERRGTVTAALATDRALELQQQYEEEKEQRKLLIDELTQLGHEQHQVINSRNKLQAQVEAMNARHSADQRQLEELEETVNQQCEQLAALNRDNAVAASALEETIHQLQEAEVRALDVADIEHLQHAARQLGQHAAAFRRTGSKKINHADIAAIHLQRLIQRANAAGLTCEEPSPRLAA